jgi:hypothetical protein
MLIAAFAFALELATPPVRVAVHVDEGDIALVASRAFDVLPRDETQKRIDDAAALGLRCATPTTTTRTAARFTRSAPLSSLSEHDCFVKLALLVDADVLIDVRAEARPNGPVVVTRVVDAVAGDVRLLEAVTAPAALDVGALVAGLDGTALVGVDGAGASARISAGASPGASARASAAAGILRVDGTPGGAVFVDGRAVGETPVVLRLPVGRHALAIVREGYVDVVADADVVAGRVVDVKAAQATLAAADPRLAHGASPAVATRSDVNERRVRAGGEEDRWVDAVAVGVGALAVGAAAIAVGAYAVHLASVNGAANGAGNGAANGAAR